MRVCVGIVAVFWVLAASAGCNRGPVDEQARSQRDRAKEALADAEAARKAGDADEARDAADSARKAADKARKLAEGADATLAAAAKSAADEAEQAAAAAEDVATWTEEEAQLAKDLGSWKAKGYRVARAGALKGIFTGMALAARQADKKGVDSLPEPVRGAAEQAADLSGRKRLPDGKPDWKGIAEDMSAWSSDPPQKIGLVLAVAYLFSGREDLALYEAARLDVDRIENADERDLSYLLRGTIYRMRGLRKLGQREIDVAAGENAEGFCKGYGPEVQAGLHLALAFVAIREGNYKGADLQIARASKVHPNNPVTVFLTGERLLADGRHEQAAESLEAVVAAEVGQEYAPLAKMIAERAREIRDKKGKAEPLVHDRSFLTKLAAAYLVAEGKRSEPARKAAEALGRARQFGSTVLGKIK